MFPIALIFEWGPGSSVGLIIRATVFYGIFLYKWHNQGVGFLKAVALDTLLYYVFAGVAYVLVWIAFITFLEPAGWGWGEGLPLSFLLLWAFLGFWILEVIQSKRGKRTTRTQPA
jgi:hypothetical protein